MAANSKCGEWTKYQVLKLIELYKTHENLYNTKLPEFHKRQMKRDSIQKIGVSLEPIRPNSTALEITSKFENLKTQFRKDIKPPKSGSAPKKPTLWCFEEMKWLRDHLVSRPSVTNVTPLAEQKLANIQKEGTNKDKDGARVLIITSGSEDEFDGGQVCERPIDDDDDLSDYLHCYGDVDFSLEKENMKRQESETKNTSCNDLDPSSAGSSKSDLHSKSNGKSDETKKTVLPASLTASNSKKKETPTESLVKILGETSVSFHKYVDSKGQESGLGPMVQNTYNSLTPRRAKRFRKAIFDICRDADEE